MLVSKKRSIGVVDLFAGGGGLGEGFASCLTDEGDYAYQIAASVEKNREACATLRLRAFYRKFAGAVPEEYYSHVMGDIGENDLARKFPDEWQQAENETLCLEMGNRRDNIYLSKKINLWRSQFGRHWVLVGGPPCQAYSTAGRGRLSAVPGYSPEKDSRNFLYKQYLNVVRVLSPSVFVLENVKGLLSAKLGGKEIFPKIIKELSSVGNGYRIFSLSSDFCYTKKDSISCFDRKKFLVNSEEYGIPQKRHRVFLVGVREDLDIEPFQLEISSSKNKPSVLDALDGLPKIRSGLSKDDTSLRWHQVVVEGLLQIQKIYSDCKPLANEISSILQRAKKQAGDLELPPIKNFQSKFLKSDHSYLQKWFLDKNLPGTLNHASRSHMPSDLVRYLFCSVYAKTYGISPKARDFPKELAPNHASWLSGDFSDRFRVQVADTPSTTVTSHIACDGHYFIHYDPLQCRTLSVREAARLQTFPDNYFFKGYKTHQYTQVGNAVPPLLAKQIATALWDKLQKIL